MSIVLLGSTSGSCTLQEQAVAGTTTLTLPTFNGTVGLLVSGTAQTASGSSVDFTSIPAGVRRITVQIAGLSYAAAGVGVIQIGAGSLTTTGYTGVSTGYATTPTISVGTVTNGFGNFPTSAAGSTIIGSLVLTNITGNQWLAVGQFFRTTDNSNNTINGYITLGGALDRVSLVATTSTFDAGTINILYE
jgi:hypothetical protein